MVKTMTSGYWIQPTRAKVNCKIKYGDTSLLLFIKRLRNTLNCQKQVQSYSTNYFVWSIALQTDPKCQSILLNVSDLLINIFQFLLRLCARWWLLEVAQLLCSNKWLYYGLILLHMRHLWYLLYVQKRMCLKTERWNSFSKENGYVWTGSQ